MRLRCVNMAVTYKKWSITPFPFPTAQTKKLLIELIWKSLGPSRQLFGDIGVEYLLQRKAVSNLLVSRRLINEASDAKARKTMHQYFALLGDVQLVFAQLTSLSRIHENFADRGQKNGLVAH